jgi:putative FmdB family regulatory protein
MPVYEYLCARCDKRFEALRPMSQMDVPIDCPRCAAPNAQKAISVFSAISRDSGGGSRMVASSAPSGCGGCSGGHCSTCGH